MMEPEVVTPLLRLRPGALKDCKDLRLLSRSLDVGELFIETPAGDKESLTKFSTFDHRDHELFVEQHLVADSDEGGKFWRQISRWVKYEEDVEDAGNRWGKAHIPALNFHSLVNLRRIMEAGLILLDLEVQDMESLTSAIIGGFQEGDMLQSRDLPTVAKTLLLKHKHVEDSEKVWNYLEKEMNRDLTNLEGGGVLWDEVSRVRRLSGFMRRVPNVGEGALVLVGGNDAVKGLAVAFVRLATGILMPGIAEIPAPVRFVFVLIGPSACQTINYVEIGRCMGVLLATSIFRHIVYEARERREILVALNEFLDASIVIPHGEWDYEMFHAEDLHNRTQKIYERKNSRSLEVTVSERDILRGRIDRDEEESPFRRTGLPFGGVWNDFARRYPKYWSDIRDGLNLQCFSTMMFLYFACISGGIAIGAIMTKRTKGYIGISESLLGSSVAGVIFALFSCQPIIILATSGGTLVFEESLFKFCTSLEMEREFLALRFWIAFWMILIGLLVVGAEGSVLVRHITRFTQEIFAVFLSTIFIWESFKAAKDEFVHLVTTPSKAKTLAASGEYFIDLGLMMTTFAMAWAFRAFKDSSFGTKLTRKILGNFGVVISIVSVSAFAYFVTPHDPNKNLQLPDATHGLKTTLTDNSTAYARPTGWFVNPMVLPTKWIFLAIFPGMLLFSLIFLELSIGELIMSRKESLMRKGTGFHADTLILCFINGLMGILGTNFVSSATVRSLAHLIALGVYSTNNPPGEKPQILGTKEQRLTALGMSILVGCSVLMGQALKFVPMSVLLGVFLYMGVSTLKGIQLPDRIVLFFKQVDKHPERPYVKQVRTWKMHVYTLVQILSLTTIWGIKLSPAALVLPLCFILLVPLRKFILVRFFDPVELEALDGEGAGPAVKKEPLRIDVTPFSDPTVADNISGGLVLVKSNNTE